MFVLYKLEEKHVMKIHVYDSLNKQFISEELNSQVSNMLKNHNFELIEYFCHKITDQKDVISCGLHSVANALLLCKGLKPEFHIFKKKSMRDHLVKLIECKGNLELFESKIAAKAETPYTIKKFQVFCECRKPFDGNSMTKCNRCLDYFYLKCIQAEEVKNLENANFLFYCRFCKNRYQIPLI